MVRVSRFLAACAVLTVASNSMFADGMIVPIRPELRVRGSWAVKYHHVDIRVRDQIASVSIDQEFINTGRGAIEVEYFFPVPPGAAIDSMTLVVNGKEFAARLLPADEARKVYESIVRRKKDPALLEYAGFGLYRTRAFPLEPGKPCKVLVTYKDVCRRDRNAVEVWYPLNTEKFSAKPIESVRVKVDIRSDGDLGPVYSPTHDLTVKRLGPSRVEAIYEAKGVLPVTDFQVFYKTAGEAVGATLLTHRPDATKDGYFLLLVSPNPRSARASVVPKDVVVVFDHSGSMSGDKIDQARDALAYVLHNLNEGDRFNVVSYSDSVETFFSGLQGASDLRVAEAIEMLDGIDATGGTNIHVALQEAMELVSQDDRGKRPAYVIFLTDGQPTVGATDERTILHDTKKANAHGARVFAFGVGYQPNVRLLDRLVEDNGGRSDYVRPKEPIEAKVSSLYNKIRNPVMTDLSMAILNAKLRDMYPRGLGDLFDGDQLVVAGRYRSEGELQTTLTLHGTYQGKERAFEYPVTVHGSGKDLRYAFVEKIWAMRRVGYLLDQIQLHGKTQEVVEELVRLSKAYGIMTPYTSFLADEKTPLASEEAILRLGNRRLDRLAGGKTGEAAQRGAMARQKLNASSRAPAPTGGYGPGSSGGVQVYGSSNRADYEAGKAEYVSGVRNVGNATLYRRGAVWVTPETAGLDLKDDASAIQILERFSAEYFDLIRANSVMENRIISSQQESEQLLLKLRGQVYLIR
jgi:Ca-activated chloride channel homolog